MWEKINPDFFIRIQKCALKVKDAQEDIFKINNLKNSSKENNIYKRKYLLEILSNKHYNQDILNKYRQNISKILIKKINNPYFRIVLKNFNQKELDYISDITTRKIIIFKILYIDIKYSYNNDINIVLYGQNACHEEHIITIPIYLINDIEYQNISEEEFNIIQKAYNYIPNKKSL